VAPGTGFSEHCSGVASRQIITTNSAIAVPPITRS